MTAGLSDLLPLGSPLHGWVAGGVRTAGEPAEPPILRAGTLAGVRSAHAVGDAIALRGELVSLAAQATRWASDLPVPIQRRTRAEAAA